MLTIAEKINATIPVVKTIIEERDEAALLDLARSQNEAGADYLDVNVGTGSGGQQEEIESMRWAVELIQSAVETPLCIDSADPEVLQAGLAVRAGRPALINSTKGAPASLERILPLAKEYDAPLVGLAMDEKGIPATVEERLRACAVIASACSSMGIGIDRIFFDPLVLPVSTDVSQGRVTLETITAVKREFPQAKTVMAVSNVSFGLPRRQIFNTAFLHMALYAGLDAAIMNVADVKLMGGVRTAEAVLGRDRHCRKYAKYWRTRT